MIARPTKLSWLFVLLALTLPVHAQDDWTDKSPHKSEFITVNGVKLHYLDWGGRGDTMLFLHGLGDTAHIFDELAPKFTNQFRVLGLTRRGHGQSDKPETGYDTETLVADVRQFLDALNISRAVLVGHSLAGDELTRFASAHPDRVIKLVYLDAAYDRKGLPEIQKLIPPELSPTKNDMESLDSFRRWVSRMSFWSDAWEANLREMMVFSSDGKILREVKPGKVSRLLMQGTVDSHPDYTKIRSPTLNIAVLGVSSKLSDFVQALPDATRAKAHDALRKRKEFQQQQTEQFRKQLPNARVVVLTNADHHCFIEREADVVREMRKFLADSERSDKSPHKSGFITVNGVKLHYLDWGGAGETLLFLHGQGDTAHRYDDFAPRFTNQFRVLGLTRRGHGESEIAETGYDTATLVADVRQFLDTLKIQRVALAGHSFAGDEVTRFAVLYPDRVIKLIYFDSAFDHSRVPESLRFKPLHGGSVELLPTKEETESPDGRRRWASRFFGEKRSRAMHSMMEGTYAETHEYGKIKAPALAFFVIGYQKDIDRAETLAEPQRQEVLEFLKTQRKYHEQEIEHFRREIPNGRVIVFTNAPHQFPLDREEEVLSEMRAFLAASDWTDKSPHKTEYITVNAVKLHYLDWGGKGETMLFLHGLGDTAHIYDEFAPKFTNDFRVLALTRRGHGESEIPDDGYDTATRVEDIRQFLDILKIPRAIVVGHSAAGNELSLFAITHPERVIKLAYLDAAFYIDGQLQLFKRMLQELPEFFPTSADNESRDSIRRWYKRMNQGWSDAWEATFRANSTISNPEKRNRALTLMLQNEARPDHTKIKAPALMITVVNPGAYVVKQLQNLSEERQNAVDDFLAEARQMKEKEIELFRKTIPNGRVVMLTNADHHCFIDREDEVLREMRAFLAPTAPRRVQISLPVPVDVEIPMPPTPVKADGKWWLVYELHVTNFDTNKIELVRVEVLKDGAKGPMATYTDEELSRRLKPGVLLTVVAKELHIESPSDERQHHVISRGNRAVMYMLTTVQREADIPVALHPRLFFKRHSAADNSQEMVVEGARVAINRKAPLVLSSPLRGEGWVAASGPSNDNRHRRNIFVMDGKARIPTRFAIDWTRIDADGRFVHGERANNANWYSHGAEVLAVANAVVADVKDGIPENEMGSGRKAVPITLETIAGNYVALDLGKSNFAVYAHLQPKSIRVRVGEKVRRGQVLGLLGNSGDSEVPHLHFQVANANSLAAAEGVPYVFDSFEVQGVVPSGQVGAWKLPSTAKADKRRREIPIENAVVRFP